MLDAADRQLRENEHLPANLSENQAPEDDDDEAESDPRLQTDWMMNQMSDHMIQNQPTANEENGDENNDTEEYWSRDRQSYSNELLSNIGNWLSRTKSQNLTQKTTHAGTTVDLNSLNEKQLLAYNILTQQSSQSQILLRIEGTAGTGKSHLINACKEYLGDSCVQAAPTGKAANNIIEGKIYRPKQITPDLLKIV